MRNSSIDEYLSWRSYASAKNLAALGFPPSQELRASVDFSSSDVHDLRNLLITDIEFNLPGDMLKKADLAGMQHGLEVRLPYLDSALVEFALNLPEPYVIKNGVRKRVLREAFSDILPDEILTRRKQGFLLPVRKWMKGGRILDELLDLARSQTSIDRQALCRIAQEHKNGQYDHSSLMWCCYVYLKWLARSTRMAA
jgi:asparagine synthase (glutamine-hydrolysing)